MINILFRFDGETTLPIQDAWSNSEYYFRFLWWWQHYPAKNVIINFTFLNRLSTITDTGVQKEVTGKVTL